MHSIHLAHQLVTTVIAAPAPSGPSGGIIDWLTNKTSAVQGLFRVFSVVGGMGFVIYQALASRGAFARIIIAGIAAAVFVWIVFNVTSLQGRVGNEVNGAGVVHTVPAGLKLTSIAAGTALRLSAGGARA